MKIPADWSGLWLASLAMLAIVVSTTPAAAQTRWQDDSDYPATAVAGSKTGVTTVQFEVTEKGRAENCTVLESSGSKKLDGESCALVLRATHFKPAKDEKGKTIRSVQTRKIDWVKKAN